MDSDNKESSIKSHKEIIQMIDELKEFENISIDDKIEKKPTSNEIIEIDKKEIDNNLVIETDEKKKEFFKNVTLFSKNKKEKRENKDVNPSTFKIGFNKNGDLVNLDFKKKEIPEEKKEKLNFKNILSKFKRGNKNKKEKSNDSKISLIKDKIGNIGKIKKLIPSRSKKEKKAEEGSEQ